MGLSCYCGDADGSEDWTYFAPTEYGQAKEQGRRKRCCSCRRLIQHGAVCTEFERTRYPISDVEERIIGEGNFVYLASWQMCEECSDLYFSLEELGFCIYLGDDMRELAKEYARDYGTK